MHALDIDVGGVTFCGSDGISAFLLVRRRAQGEGKTLRLVNLNSVVENACSRSLAYSNTSRHLPKTFPAGSRPNGPT